MAGFEARNTGIADATGGRADVRIACRTGAGSGSVTSHGADILFTFILEGDMTFRAQARDPVTVRAGDAFVIPPGMRTTYAACSGDLELLEVSLPGAVETVIHENMQDD